MNWPRRWLAARRAGRPVTTRDTIDESWRRFKKQWRGMERNVYGRSGPRYPAEAVLWEE